MGSTLEAKLEGLAVSLTPEDQEQLRTMVDGEGVDALSPSLREKLHESADGFTEEEKDILRSVELPGDSDADVEGFLKKLPVVDGGPPPGVDNLAGGGGVLAGLPDYLWDKTKQSGPGQGVIQGIRGIRHFF